MDKIKPIFVEKINAILIHLCFFVQLGGKGYTTVRMSFTVLGKIIASFGVFTDMDNYGRLITKDRLFGLELIGEVIFNTDVEIGIKNR